MATTYEVREVHKEPQGLNAYNAQRVFWTVIATEDGEVKGGDHHWVERRFAENAKAAYERGEATHGAPSREVPYLKHKQEG